MTPRVLRKAWRSFTRVTYSGCDEAHMSEDQGRRSAVCRTPSRSADTAVTSGGREGRAPEQPNRSLAADDLHICACVGSLLHKRMSSEEDSVMAPLQLHRKLPHLTLASVHRRHASQRATCLCSFISPLNPFFLLATSGQIVMGSEGLNGQQKTKLGSNQHPDLSLRRGQNEASEEDILVFLTGRADGPSRSADGQTWPTKFHQPCSMNRRLEKITSSQSSDQRLKEYFTQT
ncbi:hypothetical protein Q8A67_019064 [Cirrhinus molitorella]|uniref:Uncharacterized protein n=1 Tax=Cirrhinus molitorella TaxID=172907 RepID=A0AA88PA19_9TELE|nr:hypothetical protein Q8A67_019064 [Cirrhinus molitorella]